MWTVSTQEGGSDEQEHDGKQAAPGSAVGVRGGVVLRWTASLVRPRVGAGADRAGDDQGSSCATGLRARDSRGLARGRGFARRRGLGRGVAYAAARIPGWLLRLGPGGPAAWRGSRPAAVRRASRAGRLGQASSLPIFDGRARGPGRGAVAAPRRA